MDEKLFLYCALLFSNVIHLVENLCHDDSIKSDTKRHRVCTSYCQYEYDILEKTIRCSDMSIMGILTYVRTPVSIVEADASYPFTLNVTDSDIPIMPTSVFKGINKLTALHLETSNTMKIMPGAFNFLDDLKELYLGGNQLVNISDGIFNSLTLLEKIDLSRNRIENISNHAFVGLMNLGELYLSHNNISYIEQEFIDSLGTVRILDISWNNLKDIPNLNNSNVSNLKLSHNKINVVDFNFFANNFFTDNYLNSVDLSFNNISEIINFDTTETSVIILNHNNIKHFDKNMNIEVLDLNYNKLETIGKDILSKKLRRFYAGNNLLSSISSDTFFGLYNLEYLMLNNNNLSSIPNSCFKDLSSLTYLDLSGNKLTSFTYGTFDKLLSLKVLNISYNNLKSLHQYTLHSLGNVTDLFFQNNEISELHIIYLTSYMSQLKTVNLDHNTWSCRNLVDIVRGLKARGVSFPDGNYWQESNVRGIKCYETLDTAAVDEGSKSTTALGYSKLNSFLNEDFTKTLMYKYFNENFKDSNFFKYLETLINNTSSNTASFNVSNFEKLLQLKSNSSDFYNKEFAQSAMFNYFNKDFKNSTFFKYLENLKIEATNSEKVNTKLEEVLRSFKQTIENNFNKSVQQDFSKNDMYKNLDDDFKKFFKYLESFSERTGHNNFENSNESKVEKFVGVPEVEKTNVPSYTGLLSFILAFLIIITCILTINAYTSFRDKFSGPSEKEELELI